MLCAVIPQLPMFSFWFCKARDAGRVLEFHARAELREQNPGQDGSAALTTARPPAGTVLRAEQRQRARWLLASRTSAV